MTVEAKKEREPWEKYGPRGKQMLAFLKLMDTLTHDQWATVGKITDDSDIDEQLAANEEWGKVRVSAAMNSAISSAARRYRPQYDQEKVGLYIRSGIRNAKTCAVNIIALADRITPWAVEVYLRPFVRAGLDLSSVLPEGMDISHPIPHDQPDHQESASPEGPD